MVTKKNVIASPTGRGNLVEGTVDAKRLLRRFTPRNDGGTSRDYFVISFLVITVKGGFTTITEK